MRTIDADALIAHINECIDVQNDNWEFERAVGLTVALECISDAPTIEPEPQWFSGLPEEEGFYVVCLDKNNLLENEISVLTALWHDNQWKYDCIEIFVTDKRMPRLTYISFDELQVIKWMPLTGLQHKGELH